MCRPAKCRQCGNATWTGCGMHVDQVMSRVPPNKRCTCKAADAKKPLQRRWGIFRR